MTTSAKSSASKTKSSRKRAREPSPSEDEFEDSDALDESDSEKKPKKRATAVKKQRSPKKKRKVDADEADIDLEEGQEIVGVVVQAPKTGRVPPGQISQNTLDFLKQLQDPECNDREWFKLHDPVYRQAEKEWKDFIEAFTDVLIEVDDQIPPLPPKDVIHRIYRDTRFSNDKTPYKTGFSASFSRSGRKGIFAFYHVMIKPGDKSIIAAGAWDPAKNELQTLRSNIQRDPSRLRELISGKTFVKYFGKAEAGARQNIFGRDDELKVAPKGIDKTHPDIDLLKCRSFAVSHQFTDEQVLSPDFKTTIQEVARICVPFVHCLNDMMTIPPDEDEEE
ncbi:hypothetical protein HMN09_00271600 [Mycena chlorophos]|uniref:TIGR02453 family protein n=1 Tax=Mycena chlorophos TaxID=658473 RepID=A0A8H6TI38_MYCCL|nr:hypothetical protein HMN09_00271600 [Mycena chlorophos]